ncbi:MAG: DNA translocase FtsK [Bacteroidia bacterium]
MSSGNKFKAPVLDDGSTTFTTDFDEVEVAEPPKTGNKPRSEKKARIEKKEEKKEKEKKEKPVVSGAEQSTASKVLSPFREEKFLRFCGFFFILLSVFLLIPFISYIFTHEADFDKVNDTSWWGLFGDTNIHVENWLGKLGAILAHVFIYKGFGVSSFAFVLISFLLGFKLLFNVDLLPWGKTFKYSLFTLLFVCVTLGFVFATNSDLLWLGGTYGFQMSTWLVSALGSVGTGILLFLSATAFLAFTFNYSFKLPERKATNVATSAPENDVAETESTPLKNTIRDEVRKPIVMEVKKPVEFEVETTMNDTEDEPYNEELDPIAIGLEPVLKVAEMPVEVTNDIPMDIEVTQVEEVDEEEINAENILEKVGAYDPTLDLSSYQFPTIDLLEDYQGRKSKLSPEEIKAELEANKNKIVETLGHYNIEIEKIKATIGPTVTLFEIVPKAGVRISKIKNLEDDIALSLSALGIRIIAPMPGKGTIGIEVPNQSPETVSMRSVMASDKFQNSDYDLPIGLGRTISNEVFVADLARMPHLLMAGATGQGKSVGLNCVLTSLLYKKHPSQVKFVLVDPKKVELTLFKKIERHFLAKLPNDEEAIITDTKRVVATLNSLCIEMDNRYELLKDAQVRNIKEYNAKFVARRLNPNAGHRFLPYIVLVVDEFADLIMTAGREVETPIARLAQLARAIGIHLIIATQRPSVNIITGTIKANFPARIAFRVTSKIDSRTILDAGGADQLIGRGDMLLSTGADLIRLQCAFVDTPEVEKITDFIGSQRGYPDAYLLPEYIDPNGDASGVGNDFSASERDALFEEAAKIIVQHQQGSASLLQRRLKLGYNRAGRLIDQLEAAGIIGTFEGSKPREVKVKTEAELMNLLNGNKVI